MQDDTRARKFHIGKKPSVAKVTTALDALQTAANSDNKEAAGESAPSNDKTFALIIGISKYDNCHPTYPELPGAASDAEEIYGFVRNTMHVPEKNVIKLCNEHATREAIIQSFRRLEANTDITRGEAAIIIYYAGHGATAVKPAEWEDWYTPDNTIEMLCPVDMTFPESVPHKKKDDVKLVEGIPDRTISSLLLDLSIEKGNNITLVLDCCHSAGMNRGELSRSLDSSAIRRQIRDSQTISPECDSDIYSRKRTTHESDKEQERSGFSGSLSDSHILLAACSRHESAWEVHSAGVFTRELLRVLKERSLAELTYRSLMNNLNMPSWTHQTPHQEGNVVRRVFDPSGRSGDPSMIVCYREDEQPHLSLRAGDVLGITVGSTYEICVTDLPGAPSLGTAVVKEVTTEASSSLSPLEPGFFTKNKDFHVGYARLVNASRPSLLTYGQDLGFLKEVLSDRTSFDIPVTIAPKQNEADLFLIMEGDSVSFDRGRANSYYKNDEDSFHLMEGNSLFTLMKPRLIPSHASKLGAKDVDHVRKIITLYANFTYHLTNKSKFPITDFASVQMHELRYKGRNLDKVGDNLIPDLDKKLVKVPVNMSLSSNRRPCYGFTIENKYDMNLYAYLFYFDPSTLDIALWYHPQMGAKTQEALVDTYLCRAEELTLGFGNDVMPPLKFNVPDDRNIDICCFKLYVAVKPLDLGSIVQSFSQARGAVQQPQHQGLPPDYSWASVVIPILQERVPRLSSLHNLDG